MRAFIPVIGVLLIVGVNLAAWVTHVITCIAAKAWVLLVIGAFFAPIGIIHGWWTWFGGSWT